jgi:SAM-dependent methyltransferase
LFHLRYTPFHPQWFAYLFELKRYKRVGQLAEGRILDIGSGRQVLCRYLKTSTAYFSLDSQETGLEWYNAKPSTFGDAEKLPFNNGSFDTVVLLEVLEHLPNPIIALQEAQRVLKKDGLLVLSTPFLYPIHDAPRDYQRWTQHGLEQLIIHSDLVVQDIFKMGTPIETGILLLNLSLAWLCLYAPLVVRLPLLTLAIITIPLFNIIGFSLSFLCRVSTDTPFATGYMVVARKEK